MNFVGLGSAVIALILGIAAYKIIMGMVGFIRGSLEVVCVVICCTAGAACLVAAAYCIVEIIHRRQMYNTQFRARQVMIDQLERQQIRAAIDVTRPLDAMLNPPMSRKAINTDPANYRLEIAEPVEEYEELEPVEEVPAIEIAHPKRSWDELIADIQELKAEEMARRMGDSE